MLPIYQSQQINQQAKQIFNDDSHSGLWFERFYDYHIFDHQGILIHDEKERKNAKIEEKKEFFKGFNSKKGTRQCGNLQALESHAQRQAKLCKAQQGKTAIYKNDWLMAVGLGNSHPLENGLLWHPTLGVPYFQGSTVKGLAKALMEKWGADPKVIKKWFGSVNAVSKKVYFEETFGTPLTEELQKQLDEQSVGDFIFLDAIPVEPVMLKQSIMTLHYGDWYQKGDEKPTDKDVQPGDWHSPIPVGFLAVEKAVMQFGVIPRLGAKVTDDELEQVNNVIALALEHLGIGAKTATGYGRMLKDAQVEQAIEQANIEQAVQAEIEQAILNLSENQQLIYLFKTELNKLPENQWQGKPNVTLNIKVNDESFWFATLFSKVETWNDDDQKYALEQLFLENCEHFSNRLQDKVKVLKNKLGI